VLRGGFLGWKPLSVNIVSWMFKGECEIKYLFVNSFFCTEQFIESAKLDLLQESTSNVHVCIYRQLPGGQLWELRDSRFQMGCVRR